MDVIITPNSLLFKGTNKELRTFLNNFNKDMEFKKLLENALKVKK